jgi:hypothetical protein
MHSLENIYFWFRKAQGVAKGKPFRLPKDFDKYMVEKMSIKNAECLELVTKLFNTKWHNVTPLEYFACGFELFGENFSYARFFDTRIIRLYIERDKIKKQGKMLNKNNFQMSVDFVAAFMKQRGYNKNLSIVRQYCCVEQKGERIPIKHFQENSIDKYFLTWLIYKKYFEVDDTDRLMIPLIVANYRDYVSELENFNIAELVEEII